MSRYFAFLRAINAGRGRTVKMEVLRQAFEALGFSGVSTFQASGNVIFEATGQNPRLLESRIEKRLRATLGRAVPAFIRTDAELAEIANYRPFRLGEDDPAELNIIFLADALDEQRVKKVMALETDTDEFHVHGREIYWLRRRKAAASGFSSVPLEKTIGLSLTIRGSRTVKKLVEKYVAG